MKSAGPARPLLRAWLLSGCFCLATVPNLGAQESRPLDPEVVAILGDPGATEASLDANLVEVLGPPEGAPLPEAAVREKSDQIFAKIRCPVCQGVSIADSPSGMATHMREQVRELLAKGYGEEQILSYFERSYGEFVRLEPPLRGINVMLWFLPAAFLALGALMVFWKARAPAPETPNPVAVPATDDAQADPELARYLERVRRDSGTSSMKPGP